MRRRDLFSIGVGAAAISLAKKATSATATATALTVDDYAVQAALLLDETKRAQDWVGAHAADRGLVAICHPIAELRSTVATNLGVPASVKNAHMHLLLVLENTTAAFDARLRGDEKVAAQHMSVARTEEQTLYLALDAAKVKLPTVK
jgi:hypothetical protein